MSILKTLIAANTTRNLATWDRAIRALLPVVVLGLWFAGALPTTAAIVLGTIAAMLFPTALTGACSVYYFLGVSTCGVAPRRPVR
jgi:Protein of unknown function (DUF2892)